MKDIESHLYAYIGGIIKFNNGALLCAGGTKDHIHLLAGLKSSDKFTELIRDIKANSSSWMNKNLTGKINFGWQEGYGSFSVSYSSLEKVKNYINNQEEHHRKVTFEEEYLLILKKHHIKYDERFVLG